MGRQRITFVCENSRNCKRHFRDEIHKWQYRKLVELALEHVSRLKECEANCVIIDGRSVTGRICSEISKLRALIYQLGDVSQGILGIPYEQFEADVFGTYLSDNEEPEDAIF